MVLLDAGANVACPPERLASFALLGVAHARALEQTRPEAASGSAPLMQRPAAVAADMAVDASPAPLGERPTTAHNAGASAASAEAGCTSAGCEEEAAAAEADEARSGETAMGYLGAGYPGAGLSLGVEPSYADWRPPPACAGGAQPPAPRGRFFGFGLLFFAYLNLYLFCFALGALLCVP